MGQYCIGDVLLAPVALDSRSPVKARPVIVIGIAGDGRIRVCPVSSKPPTDAPCLPLSIDDFASGGLDLFSESYVMVSRIVMLESRQVIGKRGRLAGESLRNILGLAEVPGESARNTHRQGKSR